MPISEIRFSTSVSVDDVIAWTCHLHRLTREKRKQPSIFLMAIFALLGFLGFHVAATWRKSPSFDAFVSALPGMLSAEATFAILTAMIVVGVYFYISRHSRQQSIIANQFREMMNIVGSRENEQTQSFFMNDLGLEAEVPNGSLAFKWPAFSGFFETADHFFAAFGLGAAIVIPKRALSTEQVEIVRSWFREKLKLLG
jgi:hypothetical protein